MNVFQRMIETQALMFIYMAAGVIIRKSGILKLEARSSFIGVLINVTLPCMILHSFEREVTPQELVTAAGVLLISACCCFAALLLGLWLWRRKSPQKRSVLQFATMFSNAGNAGLPVVSLVFGEMGVFYTSFFLVPIRVLMWTLGVKLFIHDSGKGAWKKLLLNPSVLVVFVGIALMLTRFKLPAVLSAGIANIGDMTGPLSMMIIGATLADIKPREAINADALLLSAVRLAAIPLLAMAVLRLMNVDPLVWRVSVTLLAMPAATNTAILAEMYGCDHAFASKCVFVSTVLSLVTVPCLTLLYG